MANAFFDNLFSQRPSPVSARFPNEDAKNNRLERERMMFMSDPNRVEQVVSHLTKGLVPFKKQEKLGAGSNLAKVEAAMDKNDPRRGMGQQVMEESKLAIFQNPDKHPLEVIAGVYDKATESRKAATFKYLDDAQKPFLGIPLTGKTVGKDVMSTPGYEEYRKNKDEYNKTHFTTEEFFTPQAAAFQGSVLAGLGMVAEKLGAKSKAMRVVAKFLPTAFKEIPNPAIRLGLVAAAAIPEFLAFDAVSQLVSKSDQLKDQPDIVKTVAGFGAGAISMGAVSKGIAKYSESKAAAYLARQTAAAAPTAENLMGAAGANKEVGSALAIIDRGIKINKKGVWEAGPSTIFKDIYTGEVAKSTAAKPRIDESVVDRILGHASNGEPLEQATARVINQDKLLTTLDNIKGQKFFKDIATGEETKTRNKLFREAINAGNSPEDAAVLTQKGLAKIEFDDLLNTSIKHSPSTVVGLRGLGYSDDVIGQMPTRVGKRLVNRSKFAGEEVAAHSKLESEISETLHNNTNIEDNINRLKSLRWTDEEIGNMKSAAQRVIAKRGIEETSTFDVSANVKLTEVVKAPEVVEAQKAVAESDKLLGKKVVQETSNIDVSPKPIFAKGEPNANASEEEWYNYFKGQKQKDRGREIGESKSDIVTKAPKSARNAYIRIIDENKVEVEARKLAAAEERRIAAEKHEAEIEEAARKLMDEPSEAFKAIVSEFPSDEQFAKGMKNLDVEVEPLSELVKRGRITDKTIKTGVPTKEERLKIIEAHAVKRIKPKEQVKVSSVDESEVSNEAVDIYNRMQNGELDEDAYDKAIDSLMGKSGYGKVLLTAIGVGSLATLSSLAPPNANAAGIPPGVTTNFTRDIIKALKGTYESVLKEIVEKKLWVPDYIKGSFEFGAKGNSLSVVPSIANVTRKKNKLFGQDYLSPNVVADFIYNTKGPNGEKLMTSPMPEIAHRTSMAMAHTAKALGLTDDVMKSITGGESHQKEIAEAMKPLLEMNNTASKISFHKGTIENLDDMINTMIKRKGKLTGAEAEAYDIDIYNIMQMQDKNKAAMEVLKFDSKAYKANWNAIVRPLAEKYPSTRIALALEGEGMTAADPWVLKFMSEEEKVAVGHIRRLHNRIAEFIIDAGGEPILSKPYIHHASHPDFNAKGFVKDLEDFALDKSKILPLSRLYHRSFVSKQMMPDLQYVEQQYFPDIFKRVEMMDFWKKGKPNGWAAHAQAVEQLGWRAPADFMNSIKKSFAPEEKTTLNQLARQAYAFEAARLIGMNPSPGFKHLMKLEANWSNFGYKAGITNIPKAVNIYQKELTARAVEKLTGKPVTRDIETEIYRMHTSAGNISAIIQDLGFEPPKGWFEKFSRGMSSYTGGIINNTERFDRAMSFVGSMEMAAKQGMTAEQAMYSLYDTVLKTNFLSGAQNPAWLRNPKIRAMAMFQGTPFKIAEQRALLAWRAGKSFSGAAKETWTQMQNLRGLVKEGEQEFKFSLIKDALEKEKDIYGIPYAYQLMRKMMTIGTLVVGGSALFDADMTGHMLHLPFVKKEDGIKLNLNPIVGALTETKSKEDEFWVSSFFKRWLSSGVVAATKASRFYEEDIPEIYRGSRWRYFFGVPAKKEEK